MTIMRPPPAALRPLLTEYDTVLPTVEQNKQAILEWVHANGFGHGETEISLLDGVASAISTSEGDPARAARLMELSFRWKVDERIIWHFTVVKKNLPLMLNQRLMRWVMETGIRFPAKTDDFIVFMASDQFQRTARVVKLMQSTAQALVRLENGTDAIINSEQVIANKTSATLMPRALPLHDQRLPSFGQRGVPPSAS